MSPNRGFLFSYSKNMLKNLFEKQQAISIGARGELAAAKYLKKIGYQIIQTNFANTSGRRLGEIDIIAKDGQELVFVEVKTRTFIKNSQPLPEESITSAKLYKMNKAVSFYITKNRLFESSYRFDAITLLADPTKKTAILKHMKNIFI